MECNRSQPASNPQLFRQISASASSVLDPSLRAIRNDYVGNSVNLNSVTDPSLRAIRNLDPELISAAECNRSQPASNPQPGPTADLFAASVT